ncbi:Peptidase A5, thermopsin [Acidilobus saccharovorans 345-15]|uniref:Peptidase A5, thermopsin n=1 Tax=Acidilobus saccharovorans (strain DSM 16705 / JCM 18335 / VKM B-2471 / 345-15) TaxID=666510 RepID=D9Q159_ACIS3|nr:thermopsin family protease [Acidilobus saccharovorans]ADL19047.1 Peptidase A5, thermopsin [Acidilobus saccharovorans 345-15]
MSRAHLIIVLLALILLAPQQHAAGLHVSRPSVPRLPVMPFPEAATENAVGINDNGTALVNGSQVNYYYTTRSLLGVFNFYGGSFYSGPPVNANWSSVQLNANLNVTPDVVLWAQDVIHIYAAGNGTYYVEIEDNLWNATNNLWNATNNLWNATNNLWNATNNLWNATNNLWNATNPAVLSASGNGNISSYHGEQYYAYTYPVQFESSEPFHVYVMMNVSVNAAMEPVIYMYFRFVNSTYDSGWVLYDTITANETAFNDNPTFLAGSVPGVASNGYPYVIQFVTAGCGEGSTLYAYSWDASMMLYYRYDGRFYAVPGAFSLEPYNFSGGVTAENVSAVQGIAEYYYDGLVYQLSGSSYQEALWQASASSYSPAPNEVSVNLTPAGALWVVSVMGVNVSFSSTVAVTSPQALIQVPSGEYIVTATLYAGSSPVYSFSSEVAVAGMQQVIALNVSSQTPFIYNGQMFMAGNYTFYSQQPFVANLTFVAYMPSAGIRVLPSEVLVNGTPAHVTSLLLAVNGNTTVVEGAVLQYYVNLSQPVPANVNGINATLTSGWYNASTRIIIYRYFYIGEAERLYVSPEMIVINLSSPLTLPLRPVLQYYVHISLPNGTISGWYANGTVIRPPEVIYVNGSARYVLQVGGPLVVDSPVNETPAYQLQVLVSYALPNGTAFVGWLPLGYTLRFPTTINVSSGVSYELVSPEEVAVTSPGAIVVEYSPRFLVTVTYANGTTRSFWAPQGYTVKLEAPAPPLHAVRWVGTLDLPNGASVSVGEPMAEREAVTINAAEVGGLGAAAVAVAVVAVALLLLRRRP